MRLSELQIGQSAVITEITNLEVSLKLLEMGCVPGMVVRLDHIAPFGDPIAIHVADYKLSLRKSDASNVGVELLT
jgi:ferrous iron transport protein A